MDWENLTFLQTEEDIETVWFHQEHKHTLQMLTPLDKPGTSSCQQCTWSTTTFSPCQVHASLFSQSILLISLSTSLHYEHESPLQHVDKDEAQRETQRRFFRRLACWRAGVTLEDYLDELFNAVQFNDVGAATWLLLCRPQHIETSLRHFRRLTKKNKQSALTHLFW